jgi:HEAT repeat protein
LSWGSILVFACIQPAEAREWAHVDGRRIHADYLGVENGQVKLKKNNDPKTYAIGIEQLSAEDRRYVIRVLISSFLSRSPEANRHAAEEIARFGADAVPWLLPGLEAKQENVRRWSFAALVLIGKPAVSGILTAPPAQLERFLAAATKEDRERIVDAVREQGKDGARLVIAAVGSSHAGGRALGMKLLAASEGDLRAELLGPQTWVLHKALQKALAADPDQALAALKDRDVLVRRGAASLLGYLAYNGRFSNDAAILEAVRGALADEDVQVRALGLEMLGAFSLDDIPVPKEVQDLLQNAARSSAPEVRQTALRILGRMAQHGAEEAKNSARTFLHAMWEEKDTPADVRAALASVFPPLAASISTLDDARRYLTPEAGAIATLRMADLLHSRFLAELNMLVTWEKGTTGWYTVDEMDRQFAQVVGFGLYDMEWVVGFLANGKAMVTDDIAACIGLRPMTSLDDLETHWRKAPSVLREVEGRLLYVRDGGAICIVDREKKIVLAGTEKTVEAMLKRGFAAGDAAPILAWPAELPPNTFLAYRTLLEDEHGKKRDGTAAVSFQPKSVDLRADFDVQEPLLAPLLQLFELAIAKVAKFTDIEFDQRTYEVRAKDEVQQRIEIKASLSAEQLFQLFKAM